MSKSSLINEYGAALSPLIEDLDAKTRPLLNQLHDWVMGHTDMNGYDWAIVRTYLIGEFNQESDDALWIEVDAAWLTIAGCIADDLRNLLFAWTLAHRELADWEYCFVEQWVQGDLSCMCTQIQIEKAMEQRKAKVK
jgi:hypothetical protein